MINLKKIGLTALAGSLVATSVAYAGALEATGSAEMKMTNNSQSAAGKTIGMGNSIYFKGSGETDSGLNVALSFELDQGASDGAAGVYDNHSVSVGNDSLGTLTVHGHGGSNAAAALDTTAAGDLWDNTLMNTTAVLSTRSAPFSSKSGNNLLVYSLPTMIDGLAVAGSYQAANTTGSGSSAYGLTYTGIDGLSVSYGSGEDASILGTTMDQDIYKASYAYGSLTAAVSYNDVASTTDADNQTVTSYGLTFTATDDISISYGQEIIDRAQSHEDIEVSGLSVAYTTGGMTVSAATVEAQDSDYVAGTDNEVWKIGLSFAF